MLLTEEQFELEDEAAFWAVIFWCANCLRRFMRFSSSLKLFDTSPGASGVSRKTDGPGAMAAFAEAAAAAAARDECGRNRPCLEFRMI